MPSPYQRKESSPVVALLEKERKGERDSNHLAHCLLKITRENMQIKKRKLRHHRKTSLDDALCWPRFSQNVLVSELFVNHLA